MLNKSLFKILGPGIIMASSAVGGSHIIASTQAGAQFGFQLAGFIIAINVLKYPFYRFAFSYSLIEKKSVLEGYADKNRNYLFIFLFFNLIATVVNIAGGALLSGALLAILLPFPISLTTLSIIMLASYVLLLLRKQYAMIDWLSKNVMLILTIITIFAFLLALLSVNNDQAIGNNNVINSPWTFATIPFLIALMGWMPAPMELSIASSLWVIEKNKVNKISLKSGLLDFNIGYITAVILALAFMGLGALVQYGKTTTINSGGAYVFQFVEMYAATIGEWMRNFIALVAFLCIYGTTITAVDGYSRCNMIAVRLISKKDINDQRQLILWILGASIISLMIILFFQASVGKMIPFAMTLSFISAPIFAALNFSLYISNKNKINKTIAIWAIIGLFYLIAMLIIYFMNEAGLFK